MLRVYWIFWTTFCSKTIVRLYILWLYLNFQIDIEFSIHKDGGPTRVTRSARAIRIIYLKFACTEFLKKTILFWRMMYTFFSESNIRLVKCVTFFQSEFYIHIFKICICVLFPWSASNHQKWSFISFYSTADIYFYLPAHKRLVLQGV